MSSHRTSVRVLVTVSAVLGTVAAVAASVTSAASATPAARSGTSVAALAAPAQVLNGQATRLSATAVNTPVRLVLGLNTPHPAQEQTFLSSLQDKSSPNFHKYLTGAQWNARFAPSAAAEAKVVAWAKHKGLIITHRYANRLLVDVEGSVGTIQKAFGVRINNYRLGSKKFYSNDRTVTLDSSVSSIVGSVLGMNSLQQLTPSSGAAPNYPDYSAGPAQRLASTGGANGSRAALAKAMAASKRKLAHRTTSAASGKAGGLTPQLTNNFYDPTDLYSSQAYDVDALNAQGHCCNPGHVSGGSPPASSIAIATAGAHNASDYAGFQAQYPYLAYHYAEYYVDGTPTCCDGEGTLDFDWSTAMANSFGSLNDTATIYMYDGVNSNQSTFTDIWNLMLSDGHARTMSTSWSCAESYCYGSDRVTTDHNIFNAMVGQGWTLVGDADDQGPYADCSHVSVAYPASDPDVVAAGGTTLQAAGGFSSETAWTGGTAAGSCNPPTNNGGGGGGCSVLFGKPGWQSAATQCSNGRAVPDVSLNAAIGQNYYINGALKASGGTSIVAPELAGIFAQSNAYLAALGNVCNGSSSCGTIGDPHAELYAAVNGSPHHPFYDITSGCTSNNVGSGWCAGTGYDLATGLGSANLFQLARTELWFSVPEATPPSVSITGPGSGYHNSGTLSWTVTDSGGSSPATGVEGYSYRWDADPGDPVSEPHGGSGNSFYSGPQVRNTVGSLSLASAGSGCHVLYVRAWDNIGESSVSTYPTCYDATAPTFTTLPDQQFVKGAFVNGRPAVRTSWAAADSQSGVSGYYVYRSVDDAPYTYLGFRTGLGIIQYLDTGHRYRYEIYAVDNAGNISAGTATRNYGLRRVEETSSAIAYSSGWTQSAVTGASAGSVKYSTGLNRTATFSYTGNRIAWVTTRGSTRGKATVTTDGHGATTVNTNASSTAPAYVVWTGAFGNAAHTLTVKNQATAGHQRVDVDAFLYLVP